MIYYGIKVVITAILVVTISEIAKRSSFWGGIIASLPLTSVLAFIWLYHETRSLEKITELSYSIFWVVLPSLVLFLVLPLLIKWKVPFWLSLPLSCFVTAGVYFVYIRALSKLGVNL